MRNRVFRPIAAIVSILLLTGVPAQAGPVVISDVVQVLSSYQSTPSIGLRSMSQSSAPLVSGVNNLIVVGNSSQSSASGTTGSDTSFAATESLLNGVVVVSGDQQRGGVQVITQGDVEGTVCDCGEIVIPGGIPKWPLLFLAAIPFFFIDHDCDDCNSTPTPTPTPPVPTPTPPPPPPPEVPEPASLLLFGTGLLAFGVGLRRRHARSKLAAQLSSKEES